MLPRKKRLPLLSRKIEDIFYSLGEGVATGVVIASFMSEIGLKMIVLGVGVSLTILFFSLSYYFSVINSKE